MTAMSVERAWVQKKKDCFEGLLCNLIVEKTTENFTVKVQYLPSIT